MSCPDQASGRHSGPAAGTLGRAAGRRPTLAGNVSPGDAAPGGGRGAAAAAAATVRASAACERTCGAAGGGGPETWSGRRAPGKRDAGAGEEVGPRLGAQQRAGPPPSDTERAPGSRRAGRPAGLFAGGQEGEGPRPGRDCGAPGTLLGPLVRGPRRGGREGAGPFGVVVVACPSCRRSCGQRLHVGKRRRSSSLAGIGAPRAEPAGAGP